jgi:hypothetical protein
MSERNGFYSLEERFADEEEPRPKFAESNEAVHYFLGRLADVDGPIDQDLLFIDTPEPIINTIAGPDAVRNRKELTENGRAYLANFAVKGWIELEPIDERRKTVEITDDGMAMYGQLEEIYGETLAQAA